MKKFLRKKYIYGIFLLLILQACSSYEVISSDKNSIYIKYDTALNYKHILQTAQIHCIKYNKDAVPSTIANSSIGYFEEIEHDEDEKFLKDSLGKDFGRDSDTPKIIIISFLCE